MCGQVSFVGIQQVIRSNFIKYLLLNRAVLPRNCLDLIIFQGTVLMVQQDKRQESQPPSQLGVTWLCLLVHLHQNEINILIVALTIGWPHEWDHERMKGSNLNGKLNNQNKWSNYLGWPTNWASERGWSRCPAPHRVQQRRDWRWQAPWPSEGQDCGYYRYHQYILCFDLILVWIRSLIFWPSRCPISCQDGFIL